MDDTIQGSKARMSVARKGAGVKNAQSAFLRKYFLKRLRFDPFL